MSNIMHINRDLASGRYRDAIGTGTSLPLEGETVRPARCSEVLVRANLRLQPNLSYTRTRGHFRPIGVTIDPGTG